MVTSPDTSTRISDEDARKIELVQNRLSNLQSEVLFATKRLATITEEENTAREAREYAQNEKVKIETEVASLKSQKEDLETAVRTSKVTLEDHESSHEVMRTEHNKKTTDADKRIQDVQEAESALALKIEQLVTREKALDEKRSEVEAAQHAFLNALESVTWK